MSHDYSVVITIAVMAIIVYSTRIGGYLLGLSVRNIPGIKPILEVLPGCALMAVIVPSIRHGNVAELLAMLFVVALMWMTDNVALATSVGVAVLLFSQPYISQFGL